MQTLARRGVGDAAAGLSLHFLRMSEGPFSHDAGQMVLLFMHTLFTNKCNSQIVDLIFRNFAPGISYHQNQ